VGDEKIRVAGNDIDVIRLHLLIVRDLMHRHGCGSCQQLRQRAFVLRVQMLHEHEAQTRVQREGLEQVPEGLQPSGGRADADNGERWTSFTLLALSMPMMSWGLFAHSRLLVRTGSSPTSSSRGCEARQRERERERGTFHYFTLVAFSSDRPECSGCKP